MSARRNSLRTVSTARLLLVRHGQSEWNSVGRMQGHADSPLTPEGRRQAVSAARKLAGFDWVVLDMEHTPNEFADIVAQLRAFQGLKVEPGG